MADYKLLEAFGIELEYMIVDKKNLDVLAIADKLLLKAAGEQCNELERPRVNWSNELSLHVIEVKNKDPEKHIPPLLEHFQSEVRSINENLTEFSAQLLPGAVHPWMNPETEAKLWPHENNLVYKSYDRIFGCKGHGWSNLQSMHINIAFSNDEEFAKLNSAIRVVLPLIPALASSSPIIDASISDYKSSRLSHYLKNQRKIPSIIGSVVPEVASSEADYRKKVLEPMYKDIAPFDTENVLQNEWLNSRGAIPKFNYGCIEIRITDIQEAPLVDLAVASFFVELIKYIVTNSKFDLKKSELIASEDLKLILVDAVGSAENSMIKNKNFLELFNIKGPIVASEFLQQLYELLDFSKVDKSYDNSIAQILKQGSLSTRILKAVNKDIRREHLRQVYGRLCDCLHRGQFFNV